MDVFPIKCKSKLFCVKLIRKDLLKNLFILDPANRFTAQDAMNHPWFNLGIEDEGTVA